MNPLDHFGIKTRFIRGDTKSYNEEESSDTDELGNCAGCHMAYSYVFGFQPHKADCPYRNKK